MEPRRGRRPGEQTRVETKLAAWRVKRGMTQEEMANLSGLGLSTYRQYERGLVKKPGLIEMTRFAHLLGCKLTDLIEDSWDWDYPRRVAGSGAPKPPDPKIFWRGSR
jgi:transcriptional regulator with XRE-family HTH domain